MPLARCLAVLTALFLLAQPALAQAPATAAAPATDAAPSIALTGPGKSVTLTEAALRALPATTLDVSFLTSRGEEKARYTGALLWDVLERNGMIDTARHHGELGQVIRVTGHDKYLVVFSGGEIAPELGGRQILIAYERDGARLDPAKGLRLIVPGDKRGARSVNDVAGIEVQTLK